MTIHDALVALAGVQRLAAATPPVCRTMFLAANPDFVPDPTCERFLFGQNPRGWLRRIAA